MHEPSTVVDTAVAGALGDPAPSTPSRPAFGSAVSTRAPAPVHLSLLRDLAPGTSRSPLASALTRWFTPWFTRWLPPAAVVGLALLAWHAATLLGLAAGILPPLAEVATAFREELFSGRLLRDALASVYRVIAGYLVAVLAGVPLGLAIGHSAVARAALLPSVNFFRSLSPLAWIPFAVLWLGIGDAPAVFLIFMAAFFPIVLSTSAAVLTVPRAFSRIASEYGWGPVRRLTEVTLPAILPELVTTLRLTAGMCWVVVVAAEMIAGNEGLGFLIWDARNGLRADLLVCGMICIGVLGVLIDRAMRLLERLPVVRWGHDR